MISNVVAILILIYVSHNGLVASLSRSEGGLSVEELKNLNKPPVKTIQLEGGDIVDCIDFYKQPAFDHPLLKDHKIQKLPQSYVARREKQLQASRHRDKACPTGTVPINPRTTKEELAMMARPLNHTSIFARNTKSHHQVYVDMPNYEVIGYHGASGVVSVYNLNVSDWHISSTNIWIENGPRNLAEMNYIVAGWTIGLSNDKSPRLFTFWSVDGGYRTGCYNLQCRGFVQVDSQIAPGHLFFPVSIYDGPTHDVKIKIFQDKHTQNWLLSIHDEDIIVGYFPKELFPHLKFGAQHVAWGADSHGGNDDITPPMGSGHKPDGKYNHAAYFRKLMYIDQNFVSVYPLPAETGSHVDASGCFGLKQGKNRGEYWGYNFLFGGPGGRC